MNSSSERRHPVVRGYTGPPPAVAAEDDHESDAPAVLLCAGDSGRYDVLDIVKGDRLRTPVPAGAPSGDSVPLDSDLPVRRRHGTEECWVGAPVRTGVIAGELLQYEFREPEPIGGILAGTTAVAGGDDLDLLPGSGLLKARHQAACAG